MTMGKKKTPLEEAIQAKEEMGLNYQVWDYDEKMKSFIHHPFLKKFPYVDNFYGIDYATARDIMKCVRDIYENHTYWVISAAYDILRQNKTYPYKEYIQDDELKLGEIVDTYSLVDVTFPDRKIVCGSYKVHFFFTTDKKDKDGYSYPIEVVVSCKIVSDEGNYTIWSINYNHERR